MKEEQDYSRDLADIRSMMERSSKFGSLSGWAGIMAGIYALAGAYIAYKVLDFHPDEIVDSSMETGDLLSGLLPVFFLATGVLILAGCTAFFFSYKRAQQRGEKLWNATSRRLLVNMAVPLITGGLLILILISKGMIGLVAPFTLLFYGLALYNGSKFTYEEVRILGVIQIILGLISAIYIEYGLLIWAVGFGIVHIIYGIYIHYKYER
jgi:hypothetical protein